MPRSLARLSASASSHRDLSLAVFITNIAESDFRYTQGVMATYFIFGAVGQCPACTDHRFSGPATLAPETSVTCHKCGHACTIKTAIETALASSAQLQARRF
jgi:hypothetical protein